MNYTTYKSLAPIKEVFNQADKTIILSATGGIIGGLSATAAAAAALVTPMLLLPILPMSTLVIVANYFGWDTKVYDFFIDSEKEVALQEKEKLLQEALKKQNTILKVLQEKEKLSKKKIKSLDIRIEQLLVIISKLESDLAEALS